MKNQTKILIISLDGGTFDIINPLIKRGKLPTIKKLMRNGCSGILKSTIPPSSSPAWACLGTGRNQGKLGIFGFFNRKPNSYEFTVPYPPNDTFWEIVSMSGQKVGLVNLPMTYPPKEINGFMITGLNTPPGKNFTYPDDLKDELKKIVGNYEIELQGRTVLPKNEILENAYRILEKRVKVIKYLIRKKEWDLFVLEFSSIDYVQHYFWKNKKVLFDFYKKIDKAIEEIVSNCPKNTIIIILSDHGFNEMKQVFYINEWLAQKGFLKLKKEISITKNLFSKEKIYYIFKYMRIANFITRLLRKTFKSLIFSRKLPITNANIDWKSTVAYSPGDMQIYLNKYGREPLGILKSRKKCKEAIKKIAKELEKLNVNVKIISPNKMYKGKYANLAPDLLFILDNFKYYVSPSFANGRIFAKSRWQACHHQDGIFIICGPNVRNAEKINDIKIVDVAPTVLRILGLPIPKDMDGRVINKLFKTSYVIKKELKRKKIVEEKKKIFSKKDEEELKRRLESIGYI